MADHDDTHLQTLTKAKGQIKVTTPKQYPYQVLTSYTLQFLRYSPEKTL